MMNGSWNDDMRRLEEARAEVGAALRDEFDRSLLARFARWLSQKRFSDE